MRISAVAATLAVTALLPIGQTGSADATIGDTGLAHYMRLAPTNGPAAAAAAPAPLAYQKAGAPIQSAPVVYLIFWGKQWGLGWQDVSLSGRRYTSGQAIQYITDFFSYGPHTSWNSSVGQYCSGVAVGTTNCGGSGTHINSGAARLGGVWVDTKAAPPVVPDNCAYVCLITHGGNVEKANLIGQEALRAADYFGYDPNANYMIMLPKATATVGYGVYCAYHSQVTDSQGRPVAFTNMPYVPDMALSCGANWINQDNAYGNGWFDGYSIVAGHEFAEAETDPLPGIHPAWRDANGQENGDKCAWGQANVPGGVNNIGPDPNGHYFAVQSNWSNSAGGCA